MKQKMIIRADDLGYCEAVNYGIAKTVKEGLIRSVGLMPNMPYSAHGADLIRGYDVCLGQHTNICVGRPVSDPSKIPSITGENGEFRSSREYRSAETDFVVLEEVVTEIEAQYEKFKELTGQEPHYFEAHAVASENLSRGLEIVAKRHNLPLLLFSATEPIRFRNSFLIPSMEDVLPDYDPYDAVKRHALKEYADNEIPMFVTHPGFLDWYILQKSSLTVNRTKETAMLCDPAMRSWLEEHDVELITFDDVK